MGGVGTYALVQHRGRHPLIHCPKYPPLGCSLWTRCSRATPSHACTSLLPAPPVAACMRSVAAIKAGYHATGKGERRKAREAEGYSHPPPPLSIGLRRLALLRVPLYPPSCTDDSGGTSPMITPPPALTNLSCVLESTTNWGQEAAVYCRVVVP